MQPNKYVEHQTLQQQLKAFKNNIKYSIISNTPLPLHSFDKGFDFETLRYVFRQKQALSLNMQSIGLVARLLEVVEVIESLIERGQTITKRNLYYKLAHYYASKYWLIDCDLQLLTLNLQLTRSQLRILSSSKCLLFGVVSLEHSEGVVESSAEVITNFPTSDGIGSARTGCKRLVIIEKESAMYQLHQELARMLKSNQEAAQVWKQTIFLSAKGYPDSTSRTVVQALLPTVSQIFYLGDSDIYGADILLCYSIGMHQWTTFLHRVKWIQLQNIVDSAISKEGLLFQTKDDKLKCIEVLRRPYLADIHALISSSQDQRQFQTKLNSWKQQIKQIQSSKFKLQLEALLKGLPIDWPSKIFSELSYL